jgi:hypothetical protein
MDMRGKVKNLLAIDKYNYNAIIIVSLKTKTLLRIPSRKDAKMLPGRSLTNPGNVASEGFFTDLERFFQSLGETNPDAVEIHAFPRYAPARNRREERSRFFLDEASIQERRGDPAQAKQWREMAMAC